MARRSTPNEENVTWILKYCNDFTQQDMENTNMRLLKPEQYGELKSSDELLSASIYSFWQGQLEMQKFVLMPNLLLLLPDTKGLLLPPQNAQNSGTPYYLSLSECTIQQKIIPHKTQQAFTLILSSPLGSTFLFFGNFHTHRSWYKQLKQFCKLTGFLEKYKLGEKVLPGFYTCTKKTKKTQYTVQIYKTDDFDQCKELESAVENEIQILRSVKHQGLLELKRVYENSKYLFIVYDLYKGETLFKLMNSNVQLHEVQIASVQIPTDPQIIYQILQVVKFLNQHQFYHGSINPQNILINTQHQMLQITLINLSFKEYKVNDKLDWILNRAVESFLAPEIFDGIAPNILTDMYAVGCVLYFMTFYDQKAFGQVDEKDFYNMMDQFEINMSKITEAEQKLKMTFSQKLEKPTNSSSQLDLLRKLLEPDQSKRMTIKEATKHHWFVNVKSKIKSIKVERKRKKPLPSLRTIIELRSDMEGVRNTIIQQQSGLAPMGSKISLTPQGSRRTLLQPQQPSKLTQFCLTGRQNNEFEDDQDYDIPDEELTLEVPIISMVRKREPKRKPSNIRFISQQWQ